MEGLQIPPSNKLLIVKKNYFELYLIINEEKIFNGLYRKVDALKVVKHFQGRYFNPVIRIQEASI